MEALTTCDIIACEDTRKTGKMLELIFQKRMKDRFRTHFGTNFDTFMDGDEEIEETNETFEASEPTESSNSSSTGGASETLKEEFFSRDKDEMLLHRLQWADA